MLSHIESLTFARAPNLFACVSDFNDGARAFYRKQGIKIGPMPNFLIPRIRRNSAPEDERARENDVRAFQYGGSFKTVLRRNYRLLKTFSRKAARNEDPEAYAEGTLRGSSD